MRESRLYILYGRGPHPSDLSLPSGTSRTVCPLLCTLQTHSRLASDSERSRYKLYWSEKTEQHAVNTRVDTCLRPRAQGGRLLPFGEPPPAAPASRQGLFLTLCPRPRVASRTFSNSLPPPPRRVKDFF
jgi:hypothetical protein